MKIFKKIFSMKNIKWFILFAFIIIVVCFFVYRHNLDKVHIENAKLYQYFSGNKVEYKGSITFNRDGKVTTIRSVDKVVNLDSIPVYFSKEKKVLFPENMNIVFARRGIQKKINYYTIVLQDDDDIYLDDRNIKNKISEAVLFDGSNLYFFIDDVEIKFKEEKIKLSKLSYIIVNTVDKKVEVYNKEKDECTVYLDVDSDVIIEGNNYKVNASFDYLYYNNRKKLLFKQIDKLSNYN